MTGLQNAAARRGLPLEWKMARRVVSSLLVLACLCACQRTSERDLLDQAEQLCLAAQWEDAKPLLKQHLLTHPEDSGAHFYLGRCYLLSADFRPLMAEGELQTALSLFLRNGKKSPVERFKDDYFELICYVESAKVFLLQAQILRSEGVEGWQLQGLLERSKAYAASARAVKPDSEDVAALDRLIRESARPLRSYPASFPFRKSPVNT